MRKVTRPRQRRRQILSLGSSHIVEAFCPSKERNFASIVKV